jgi:8-oxo-dGTP pyrophosphatase MutT (NUDIX family)
MAAIREDGREQIEVHVAGACIRANEGRWQLLAAQRTKERSLFPLKWECGGGQVRKGEDFPAAIKRQIFEEFGLEVDPLWVIAPYAIHVPEGIIPGVRFLCLAKHGTARLNKREFLRYRWVEIPVPELDWIPGMKEILDANLTIDRLPQLPDVQSTSETSIPAKRPPGFVGLAGNTKAV